MTARFILGLGLSLSLCFTCRGLTQDAALATVPPSADTVSMPVSAATDAEIAAYEKQFFELSFEGESAGHRLDRLETFIFGTTSKGTTASRIGRIAQVAPLKNYQKPAPAAQPTKVAAKAPEAAEPNLNSPGNYPHITALEAKILNETYPLDPLTTRLSRLETKAFGAPSKSHDLEERTDAIDRYMRAKMTPREMMIGQRPDDDDDLPPVSAALEKRYESADEDPGTMIREEAIRQELMDAQKTSIPTKDERTLSRIAWCEQQVFGHAFPEMHLLKRLHNLNHELFPNDKEQDIQLMDRIDTIVKEVVLRKQPHQPATT